MTNQNTSRELSRPTADLDLQGGCALCGGVLAVRLSPAGARTYCAHCRWIAAADIEMVGDGVRIQQAITAQA